MLKPGVFFQNSAWSPLGRIFCAGFEHYSRYKQRPSMRVLGQYALVYVVEGQGHYHDAGGLDQEIGAGDLMMILPGIAHDYWGEPWEEFWIIFEGRMFDLWREQRLLNPDTPVVHLEPVAYWLRRFQETVAGSPPRSAKQSLEQICRLQLVLSDALLQDRRNPAAEQDSTWLARACAQLEADLLKPLDLESVAAQLGTSYEAFRKRFARLANVSPSRYRTTRLMDLACELLHREELTNKEIAERLGICDEYHFSRRFQQITGMSPSQFRKHWHRG